VPAPVRTVILLTRPWGAFLPLSGLTVESHSMGNVVGGRIPHEAGHEDGPLAVLEKAVMILSAFEGRRSDLTLTEVVRHSGLPQSTVHRLMDQLVRIGWLERERRAYRLGLRLLELGAFASQHNRLRKAALPHLIALQQRTGFWVHLAVLDGFEIVYLEQIGDPRRSTMPFQVGGRLPAHCTAAGKALLAFGGDPPADLTQAELAPRTRQTITQFQTLQLELATVRSEGVAFDREECFPDVTCAAAPLRGAGRALAAISVSQNAAYENLPRLASQVNNCARLVWASMFDHAHRAGAKAKLAPSVPSPESSADSMLYWLRFNEWET
jgi:DNA-binding IclR family transcriptional regulator